MLAFMTQNWWVIALRGLLAVLFGLAALIWPGPTVLVLVALFAGYAIVDGVFNLGALFLWGAAQQRRWAMILEGIIGIVAGVLALIWPEISVLIFVYLIAVWGVVTGIFEIIASIWLRQKMAGEIFLGLTGVLSLLLGVLLLFQPQAGVVGLAWIIGAYALIFGVLMIVLGFRLRSWGNNMPQEMI
jgi:uncharacterized membrane protein HdeD (DUF308 family)